MTSIDYACPNENQSIKVCLFIFTSYNYVLILLAFEPPPKLRGNFDFVLENFTYINYVYKNYMHRLSNSLQCYLLV